MTADSSDRPWRRGFRCGKIGQPDRLTAEAFRAGLEIWNRATGVDRKGICVVVFRCKQCGELHVGRQHRRRDRARPTIRPQAADPLPRRDEGIAVGDSRPGDKNCDIQYLIDEFTLD